MTFVRRGKGEKPDSFSPGKMEKKRRQEVVLRGGNQGYILLSIQKFAKISEERRNKSQRLLPHGKVRRTKRKRSAIGGTGKKRKHCSSARRKKKGLEKTIPEKTTT